VSFLGLQSLGPHWCPYDPTGPILMRPTMGSHGALAWAHVGPCHSEPRRSHRAVLSEKRTLIKEPSLIEMAPSLGNWQIYNDDNLATEDPNQRSCSITCSLRDWCLGAYSRATRFGLSSPTYRLCPAANSLGPNVSGAYSLGPPDSDSVDAFTRSLLGAYSLVAYSLGAYSLAPADLD